MARIRKSNPYDDVENAIRRKRDRAIYFTLAISLIFAIIFLILWFCIPSDMPVDEQVKQVSDDIFNILRSNELVPEMLLIRLDHLFPYMEELVWVYVY